MHVAYPSSLLAYDTSVLPLGLFVSFLGLLRPLDRLTRFLFLLNIAIMESVPDSWPVPIILAESDAKELL